MEFPAFRSREWLQAAFEGPTESVVGEKVLDGKGGDVSTAGAKKRLLCPDFVFRGLDTTPRLLLATPSGITTTTKLATSSSEGAEGSSSLYLRRAASVAKSIRQALFRQALFQIQNVEVQTLKTCSQTRRLLSSEVLFDSAQRSAVTRKSDVLRIERWVIDRCGDSREFEVRVSRDAADFFSVQVTPLAWSDKLRSWWFRLADANEE